MIQMLKRGFDLFCASIGMIVLSPLLAACAILLRITTGSPVIFRQTRIGLHGKEFQLLKFRTMKTAAERSGKLTVRDDLRVTPVGAILRKYKLDELPQLLNVVRGDMSLVGPRPEVPEYVAHYSDREREIVLSVRPGITDAASIRFRDESSLLEESRDPERFYISTILPEKVAMYQEYVETRSFIGDLRIILATVKVLVAGITPNEGTSDHE
jgi:lipopolysaccharide/colanic/teichoic acid biosynthesis glycosyltransferase